jgi:hypothetical protein
LFNVPGVLQRNRERRVRQRIVRREDDECHGRCYCLIEPAGIAQRSHQPVVRLNMCRIGSDRGAKALRSFLCAALGKQILPALGQRVGDREIGHGWL